MRWSQYPVNTTKETPADAEVVSHQLMLRAGMIRKLAAGLYTWMPLGLRVLRKVEHIVREEMNRAGALEVLMPAVQPAELWEETGRWEKFGPELLRIKDRQERDFCLGPTHEEVITDFARSELRSYKQLPVNFYQIQTKFRDEIRPRFGVMRAREFLDEGRLLLPPDGGIACRKATTPCTTPIPRIFTRLGLKFRAVKADTGAIGGSGSQEFHVLADSGEDAIAFSDGDEYAANLETGRALPPAQPRAPRDRDHEQGRDAERRAPSRKWPRCSRISADNAWSRRLFVDGERRRRGRARGARRPRAQCDQGAEAARRGQPTAHGHGRTICPRPSAPKPGFIGPVGVQRPGVSPITPSRRWPTSSSAPTEDMPTSPA